MAGLWWSIKMLPTGNTMRSARSSKEEKRKPNLQDIDAFQYPAPANKVIFRPISCYTASRISEVVEDISLDEKLVRCDYQDDVCFGKVGSVLHTILTDTKCHTSGGAHRLQYFVYESGNP